MPFAKLMAAGGQDLAFPAVLIGCVPGTWHITCLETQSPCIKAGIHDWHLYRLSIVSDCTYLALLLRA